MNNIKVRTKLVIVMVIALIALALCTVISNTSLSGLGNNALDIIENDYAFLDMMKQNQAQVR